jgi:putative phosphoribosyl transferase
MSAIIHPGTNQVKIPTEQIVLNGELSLPEHPHGIVLLANGTGSSGMCSRNRRVAAALNQAGLATLLIDLRSTAERQRLNRPQDIATLADRLLSATEWLGLEADTGDLQQGYFASGIGAGVALVAAAKAGHKVHAVVCRGGRPDLARDWLSEVMAPTLFLVGADDPIVLQLNREAQELLRCPRQLVVVPRASHSLGEPAAMEQVSRQAVEWFGQHLHVGWHV